MRAPTPPLSSDITSRPVAYPVEVEIASFSRPALGFSGDFHRCVPLADGVFFAVGDVKGKGIEAAVMAAMIQELLEKREDGVHDAGTLHSLVVELDAMLLREGDASSFATVALGVIHRSGQVDIVNAGHCPPLLVAPGNARAIPAHGPPLGLIPGLRWTVGRESLDAGTALCLYSDGVMEATSADDEEYGISRLATALDGIHLGTLDEVAQSVVQDVHRHAGTTTLQDDLTLLLLRNPAPGAFQNLGLPC